jgi:DNA processing protein
MVTALKATPLDIGRKLVEEADRLGAGILIPADQAYPELLQHIPDPPPILFTLGKQDLLQRPAVAIVGSRDHSAYGAVVCRSISGIVAGAGVTVVSGMARGLDAVAQTAALDAGGATIGVLGNGLGVIYPAANRTLYERVSKGGLLITEFPPGERPMVGSFPRRNRLISGLARVTLVMEAAVGSGALITASTALEQGREVMAVPGNVTSVVSIGTNRLIRDGAAPVLEAADVLQHFPECTAATAPGSTLSRTTRDLPQTLTAEERELAALVGPDPIHPDVLATRVNRPVNEVLGLLCVLEIAGVVEQSPGRVFRRV